MEIDTDFPFHCSCWRFSYVLGGHYAQYIPWIHSTHLPTALFAFSRNIVLKMYQDMIFEKGRIPGQRWWWEKNGEERSWFQVGRQIADPDSWGCLSYRHSSHAGTAACRAQQYQDHNVHGDATRQSGRIVLPYIWYMHRTWTEELQNTLLILPHHPFAWAHAPG